MNFAELSYDEQIKLIRREYELLIEAIFNEPKSIFGYVSSGELDRRQAKQIRNLINTMNHYTCFCCRKFDKSRLELPISETLEPLIDIVKRKLSKQQQ